MHLINSVNHRVGNIIFLNQVGTGSQSHLLGSIDSVKVALGQNNLFLIMKPWYSTGDSLIQQQKKSQK